MTAHSRRSTWGRRERTGLLLALGALLVGCIAYPSELFAGPSERNGEPAPWTRDVVDHHGLPQAAEDWSFVPFSDQGSWQGYALPPSRSGSEQGFSGPFLMAEGRWLGPQVSFGLRDPGSGDAIELTVEENYAHPGALRRGLSAEGLEIRLRLWFHSTEIALVEAQVHNSGSTPRTVELVWSGGIFEEMGALSERDGGVAAATSVGTNWSARGSSPGLARIDGRRWSLAESDPVEIPTGRAISRVLALTSSQRGDDPPSAETIGAAIAGAEPSWAENRRRWHHYLEAVDPGSAADPSVRVLAVKSLQTLVNNWRGPAGRLRHDGLFPSSNVGYFNGFWAWDSWKHAVALARFDPDLAGEQIRAMFDHQDERGMIADVVYLDPAEDNWRDTKPPLAGWAIEAVHEASGDLELVRELYPRLVEYHHFWSSDRDHDRDGLAEYGSTDGTIEAARWESGMDNAIRFDETEMLENRPAAWSMSQESVDLNSYLYREKLALARFARLLGHEREADRWEAEADRLGELIRTTMFDEATGWFYDVEIETEEIVPVRGPEGWIPLWAGVASPEQAERARETMLDPARFRTFVPFPTVARDEPGFSDGYWRGLVWLDQVYFAIEGLRRYGYRDDADQLTRQLFENLAGATTPGAPLWENYHPLTGEGRNVKHFSWSAAHLLLLALDR